ncbi:MAG TPA: glycoside hydrolase family 20 zincin-like fold domain-containing protein, partial [Flavobacterium sp.]|nr:glycoside hydrolase family 20 zincin-like fold domain-containing protein [Flavobacterium sp.]
MFTENNIAVIPKPAHLQLNAGSFQFSKNTQFIVANAAQTEIASILTDKFKKVSGWNLEVSAQAPKKDFIQFVVNENLEDEAYKLDVNSDRVIIISKGNAGFLYGMETLRQLLPVSIESSNLVTNTKWIIPNVSINDQPRYKYRGLMLDVSRHFFKMDYVKKTIDRMAMLKMNVL